MSTSWISIQATEEGNSQHANVDVVGNCEESSNQISIVVIKQSLIQIAKDIQQENTTIDNVILDKFKELQNHLSRRSFIDYNTSVEQQLEHDSLSFLTYKLKSDYLSQYIKYNNNILTEAYYSTLNACKSMHHTDLFDHSLLLRLATQALQTGDLQTSKHILSLQRLQDNSLPHVLQQLTNQLSQKAMTGSYESLDNYTWTSRSQNAASLSSELLTSVSKSNAEFMKFLLIAIFQLSRGRSFQNAIEDLTLCANSSDLAQHGSNSIVNDSVVETTAQEVNENIDTSAINITTEDVTANVPTPLVSVDVVSTRSRRKGIIAQSSRGGDDDAEESARPITSTVSAEGYTSRGIMLQQTILGILTSDEWCSHQQLSPSSSSNLRSHIASLSESEPVSSVVDNANDNDDNDDHNTPNRSEYNLNRLFRLTNNVFFKLKDDLQPPFSSFTNCSDSATDVTISEVDEYNVHKLTFAGMSNAIHELQMEVCSIPDEEESFDSEASISKLCSYIPSAALLCWTDILEMNGGKYALFRVLARLSAHELIFLLECSITVVLDTKENSSSCLLPLAVDIIMCVMCEWFDVGIDFVRHHESDNHDNHTYLRQLWCVLLLIASPRISYLPVSFYDQLDAIVPCFDSEFIQHSLSISPLLLPHMLSGCQMVTYSVFINYVKRAKAMQRSKAMFAGVEQSVLVFQESQLPSLIQNEKDTFLNVKLLVERVLLAASHGESTDSFILLVCFKRLQPIDLMRLETILTLLSTWWNILRLLLPTCSITNESSTRLLTWVLECNSKISECITQNLSLFQDSSSYVSGDICSQLVRTFANLYESLIRVHKYDFLSSVHGIIEAFLVNKPVSSALNSDECLFKIISVAFIALENFIVDVQTIWSDTDHTKSDIRMIIYSIQSVTEFLCNFIYLSTDRIDLSEYFLASYIQPQTYIMTLVSFAQGGMHRLKSNELADSMLLSVETNLMESINNCLTVVYYIALYSKVLSIYSTLDVIFVIHEFIVHYQLYKCDSAASVLWLADQLFKPFTKLIFDKTNLSNIQIDDTLQQLSRVGCPFELDDITTNTFRDLVHHLAEIFYLAYNFPLAANLISDDEVSHTLPLSLTPSSLAVSQMYVLLQLAEKIKALNFSRSNFRSSYLMIYEYESKTTRAIDFKNSIVPYLFHSLKNGHGNPTEFDPMNAHAYFEFVSTAVTEESAKNNLMHSSVSFDLGHHLLKHGGSFPFFGPNCVSSDSDSAEVANRKRLCGAIQLFVDSLAATPFHLATWIGLHKACSDRLQQVTDLIAESFVVLDLPLEVLVYVSFLSVEEMLSAVCDGALMKAVREVRGRALCEVLKHDPIVSETVRLMCQEISVDSSKRKSPNDFTFDADGRCVAKQPRMNGMAVRSITPRDSDNSDDCDVGLDNINATVESDQAYVILLDTMALKNTYTNMVKNCVVMIQLLNEHQSSVNTSSNTTSSIVQMMSSTCFDEDVSAVIESHALTFYNLSLEHPKNSNGRRQLQSESLAAFKTVLKKAPSTRKLLPLLMIGKLTRQLYKTDIKTSLAYLIAAQNLASTDEIRAIPSLKTTRVASLYQLHSVLLKICVELVSNLCATLFNQLKVNSDDIFVSLNTFTLSYSERVDDNRLTLDDFLAISESQESTGYLRKVSDFQNVLQRILKIMKYSFWKLRECRKLDNFEAFSVYRISDVIFRLSSIKSDVKLLLSDPPSKNESSAFDILSDWLYSVASAFQLPDLSPKEAQLELRKLFDKRRQQIVGIWSIEVSASGYDQIFQRRYKYDAVRRKMLTRYVDLIGMNSDLDSALQIATWTALSKDNYGTVNFMLQYSFQGYLSLLTHTTENLPIDVSTSLVVMSSVETGREEISSSQISSSEPPVMHTVTETTPVPASDKLFQDAFQLYRFGHKRIDVTLRVEFERVLIILYQKTLLGQEQPLSAAGQCNIHALVKLCLKQPWASSKKGKSKLSVASTAQRHVSSDKKDSTNEVEASQCTLVLSQSQSQFEGASDLAMSEDYEEIVPMYFESVEYI